MYLFECLIASESADFKGMGLKCYYMDPHGIFLPLLYINTTHEITMKLKITVSGLLNNVLLLDNARYDTMPTVYAHRGRTMGNMGMT